MLDSLHDSAVVLRLFRGSRCRNFSRIRGVGTSWYGMLQLDGFVALFALELVESLFGWHFHHPWKCRTMGVVASVRSQTNRRRFNVTLLTPMLVILVSESPIDRRWFGFPGRTTVVDFTSPS